MEQKDKSRGARTAVILLAGRGSRLDELTGDRPKCLVEVNGTSILHRMLDNLGRAGVHRAVLVVGYRAEQITASVGDDWRGIDIVPVVNDRWDTANNIVSLRCAVDHLDGDFLLVEGDIVVETAGVLAMTGPNRMAVARYDDFMDGTVARVGSRGTVERLFLKNSPDRPRDLAGLYKTVKLYSLSYADFTGAVLPRLDALIEGGKVQEYYESAFAQAVATGQVELSAVDFSATRWAEIDDKKDLYYAEKLFS